MKLNRQLKSALNREWHANHPSIVLYSSYKTQDIMERLQSVIESFSNISCKVSSGEANSVNYCAGYPFRDGSRNNERPSDSTLNENLMHHNNDSKLSFEPNNSDDKAKLQKMASKWKKKVG